MKIRIAAALAAGLLAAAAPLAGALAQVPASMAVDPSWKVPEVIAFIGLKPGSRVADIVSGRLAGPFARAVAPNGKLYAVMPAEVVKAHPEVEGMLKAGAAASGGVMEASTPPVNAMNLPAGLDAVFIRQNYHDLYDRFMGPADVAGFNRQAFAALKPGGVYVILDHDAPGAPLAVTETLHRIDKAQVIKDVTAAGFRLDSESRILANSADDHSKMVFDPAIRGKTDQFLLKFRKP